MRRRAACPTPTSLLAEIYGEALARTVECAGAPDAARRIRGDELVGHLLALHGIHPDPAERRVEDLIGEIQARLQDGATVGLSGLDEGVARVQVSANGPEADLLSASVRDLILGAVPDLVGVEATATRTVPSTFIPIESVRRRPA